MWNKSKKWGYKEAFAINIGLVIVGLFLQGFFGNCRLNAVKNPYDFIAIAGFAAILFIIFLLFRKTYIFNWIASLKMSVATLCCTLVLIILMGLIRQGDVSFYGNNHIFSRIGFSAMLSSWAFVLEYVLLIIILEFLILKNIFNFKINKIPFLFNHFGLFVLLVFGFLSTNNLERYKMIVTKEFPEWRATDVNNKMFEMPIAIQLKKFDIEEYPAKLMLVNSKTGNALSRNKKPLVFEFELQKVNLLSDWEVSVLLYVENAAPVFNHDTLKYVEFLSEGASAAAFVEVRNIKTNETKVDWLSCGSFMFPFKAIELDDSTSLVMPRREAKRYISDVDIYTIDEKSFSATVEVNKPIKIRRWQVYQVSYDQNKGKWSDISIFELIHDIWIDFVYIGLIMMIIGAVLLFILPKK